MNPRRFHSLRTTLGALGLAVFLGLTFAHAADDLFTVTTSTTPLANDTAETNFVVHASGSVVQFVQPMESKPETERAARRIKFVLEDQLAHVALEWTTNSPALATEANAGNLQRLLEERFPGAQVSPLPSCQSATGPCPGFEIERKTPYNTSLTTRLAFVPLSEGTLEVSLTAASENFRPKRHIFPLFLGRLKVQPQPAGQ